MTKLKAAILDDEPRGSKLLAKKIKELEMGVDVVAVFQFPEIAVSEIEHYGIDVLFLDVEMPGLNGFDFLQKLSGYRFEVIFTTAYDEYVLDALRHSAVDYLLKPVMEKELRLAISRLKNKMDHKKQKNVKDQKDFFAEKRLPLSTAEGIYLVDKSSIIRVAAFSNYCTFFMADGKKIVVSKTLKEFENLLPEDHFVRVNRSAIVNLHFIMRYKKENGGTLEMADGMEITVSPQKKEALIKILFGTG